MIYWIPVYTCSGRKWKKNEGRLSRKQLAEMDYILKSACLGLDFPDIRKIYEEHRQKKLFYHMSENTGLRYHFEVDKKTGEVTILSVDVDNKKLTSADDDGQIQAICLEYAVMLFL